MSLPSEFGRIVPTVELAFGADLSASTLSWTWTDVTDRLLDGTVPVTRGRPDEQARSSPTSTGFTLDNQDGHLTPGDPRSQWWPHVRRGTPCRVWFARGVTGLALTGQPADTASTPDHASLDVTGDLALWFEGDISWFEDRPTRPGLIGKFDEDIDEISYMLWVSSTGHPNVAWSPDGTVVNSRGIAASLPLPWTHGRHAVAVELDVDDGAGGTTARFYTADTAAGPWILLGDPVAEAGTTSVFASSQPLEVGVTATDVTPPIGRAYTAGVRSGDLTTGTIVANPDFEAQDPGTTSFADSTGKTWTVNGDAEITDRDVRFVGQVDAIVPSWPAGDNADTAHAVVDIEASGILHRLTQGAKPLNSTLFRRITAPAVASNVLAYWPLEDGRDANTFGSPIAGVNPMTWGGEVQAASDDSLPSSAALPSVSGGQPAGWHGAVPSAVHTTWTCDMYVFIPTPATAPAETPLFSLKMSASIRQWTVAINDSAVVLRGYDADGNEVFNDGRLPNPGDFGRWVRWSLTLTQNGPDVDYEVRWIWVGGFIFAFTGTRSGIFTGRATAVANLFAAAPPDGMSWGHPVVSSGLPAGWLEDDGFINGAGTGFIEEPAGIRVQRLCDEENIPVRIIGDPELSTRMGPQQVQTLPDLLQECADADMGILSETRDDLALEYRTRSSLYNQPAALELDAGRGAAPWIPGDITNPFAPTLDDQAVENDVTVKRDSGSLAREVDDDHIAAEGRYDTETTINVAFDGQLPGQASWRLHLGTVEGLRVPALSSEMTVARDGVLTDWLDTDLGDRVTVASLPAQHPLDDLSLLIQGYTETISPTRWAVAWNTTPAGPWEVGVRDDDARGMRDSAFSELATSFDVGTDTSMSVDVTAGQLWTTSPPGPFDVNVGGVQLTVTAIAGASSPQTFTVDQAPVNGITKTIPSGTAVRLWRPTVRAL